MCVLFDVNNSDMYVRDIKTGITASDGEPEVLKESAATAHVNGHNLLGPVVGNFCMDMAISKARSAGVGWVVAKGYYIFLYYGILVQAAAAAE